MFMDWQTQHSKDVNSPQINIQFYTTPIKIITTIFVYIDKSIIKFVWKGKRPRIAKMISKTAIKKEDLAQLIEKLMQLQ